MSFADSVRAELQSVPTRRPCCKRALAAGLLIDADFQEQGILLSCRSPDTAAYAAEVIRKQFGRVPELREEIVRRHRYVRLIFESAGAGRLIRMFGKTSAGESFDGFIGEPFARNAGPSVGMGSVMRVDPAFGEATAQKTDSAFGEATAKKANPAFGEAPVRVTDPCFGQASVPSEDGSEAPEAKPDPDPIPPEICSPDCESCRSAFLRGAFLSVGTLNDPHKSTHLELTLRHPQRAAFLEAFLVVCGYPPGIVRRGDCVGLYYKDCTSAEDLVALCGAGKTAMEMMNVRIEREIRNQENRATNCVAKNIEKSVSASARQMAAIERLTVTGMLAQMPEPLRVTARLRAEHPDATLEELRLLHLPPITKSGLNHRLQKLVEAAEKP